MKEAERAAKEEYHKAIYALGIKAAGIISTLGFDANNASTTSHHPVLKNAFDVLKIIEGTAKE
jgi:hypothetical protein